MIIIYNLCIIKKLDGVKQYELVVIQGARCLEHLYCYYQREGAGGCIISERESSTLSMCNGYDELEEFCQLCTV